MSINSNEKSERLAGALERLVKYALKNYKDAKDRYYYASTFSGTLLIIGLIAVWLLKWLSNDIWMPKEPWVLAFFIFIWLINLLYSWKILVNAKRVLQGYIFAIESAGISLQVETTSAGNQLLFHPMKSNDSVYLPVIRNHRTGRARIDWKAFDEVFLVQ